MQTRVGGMPRIEKNVFMRLGVLNATLTHRDEPSAQHRSHNDHARPICQTQRMLTREQGTTQNAQA